VTSTDTTTTRHLVDPELAPILDVFPALELSAETLPLVREAQDLPIEGAPDPEALYPDVIRTEKFVPGYDGHPDVRVLYYEPTNRTASSPALVWIHGGGYILGKADYDEIPSRRIVTETSAVVVSVDYRLAPESQAPGLVSDAYAALKWVHDNAGELGVDQSRIAIGGMSAGGGLAAALAILARDKGEIPVAFQFLNYPMLDDRTASTVEPSPFVGEFVWRPEHNVFGWTSMLGSEPGGQEVSEYTAPARVDSVEGLPPAFIAVGSLDLFLEEDLAYAGRLLSAGIPTELHVYPGGFHAFDNLMPTARVAQAFTRDGLAALNRALNG
jgi:triacylglycerol lipase